jgi:CheY-like chemotaxis protein
MSDSTAQPLAVLVEDNLMFAMMVEPSLRRLGYQVRTLAGGPAAAAQVAALHPEILFVNLASSRVEGADLVRQLRAEEALASTPIIGYAGHVERQHFQAGREAGATLVVPNSAMRKALPEVLAKLHRRLAGDQTEWPEDD